MPTAKIPVNVVYLEDDGRAMRTHPGRPHNSRKPPVAAKPFEADLKVLPKAEHGPRHIGLYDDATGITYLMHNHEVRKMLTSGAKIEGGVVSGLFGFGRVSSSLTLTYLGPKPVRVGLIDRLTAIAKEAGAEVGRVIKAHSGSYLSWDHMPSGESKASYGDYKVTAKPTLKDSNLVPFKDEWETVVEFVHAPRPFSLLGAGMIDRKPDPSKNRKFIVRQGEFQDALSGYFQHIRVTALH